MLDYVPEYAVLLIGTLSVYLILRQLYDRYERKTCNYPPGECGLPILGNLLSIISGHDEYVRYLTKSYGPISMIKLGHKNCIVVNDFNICKIYLKKKEFQNHAHVVSIKSHSELNGKEMWKRRATVHECFTQLLNWNYLQSFVMKNKIKIDGKNINIYKIIDYWIFVLSFRTIFGSNYIMLPPVDSDEYKYFRNVMDGCHRNIFYSVLFSLLFGYNKIYNKYATYPNEVEKLITIITNWINRYSNCATADNSDINSDDCCLKRMLLQSKQNPSYTKINIIHDIVALFEAITNGTPRITTFCLIQASIYNDIQSLVHRELVQRNFKNVDKFSESLKFDKFRAFIFESMRHIPAPFGLPRSIIDDNVKLGDYNIPKGSIILVSYYHMMHDNASNEFDLNNFLGNNGKFKYNAILQNCIFGIGPRNCPGKSLALKILYLLLADLLQHYEFELSDESKLLPIADDGMDDSAKMFTFNVRKRIN
eukprot:460971_1